MNLIRSVRMDDEKKRKKDIDHIRSELSRADNEELHRKVELLQAFLDKMESGLGGQDIDEAYEEFENAEKLKDITAFAEKEDVDQKSTILNPFRRTQQEGAGFLPLLQKCLVSYSFVSSNSTILNHGE